MYVVFPVTKTTIFINIHDYGKVQILIGFQRRKHVCDSILIFKKVLKLDCQPRWNYKTSLWFSHPKLGNAESFMPQTNT